MATVARPVPRTLVVGAGALLAGALLIGVALENYLLFHALVEMAAVGVALALFILVWSSRPYLENAYFLVLGIGMLFVGGLTLLHSLAFDGMGVFVGSSPGLASAVLGRGGPPRGGHRRRRPARNRPRNPAAVLLGAYAAATAALLAAIAIGVFPDVTAGGVTAPPFRLVAEVVVVAGIAAGMLLLYRRRDAFDEEMLHLLLGALGAYLVAEICFALTVDVIGPLNLAGHLLRLLAFYLFALAIVEFGVRRPWYSVLFRGLRAGPTNSARPANYVEGLLEQAPGPILVLDAEGKIRRLNRAFERLTGRSAGGLVGRFLADVLPAIAPTVREAGAAPQGVEGTVAHRDGTVRTVLWTAATLRNPDGTVASTVVQGQDVTAGSRPSSASARRSMNSRSRTRGSSATPTWRATTCRSRSARSSRMSSSSSAGTETGSTRTPRRSSGTSWRAGSGIMQRLVQDLLLLSRIGAKKRPFEPVDVEQALLDVLRDHRHQIRELGAVVQHDPLPVVCGDPAELPLVFSHLLQNSLKFRSDEPPRIRITAEREDGWWRFAVADNGIGIEARVYRPDLRPLPAPSHA